MPGLYAMRTGFLRSAAKTASRACPPYAAAHHERLYVRLFEGNKRVSIQKPLMMSGFAISAAIPPGNWVCFALGLHHRNIFQVVPMFSNRWVLFRIFPGPTRIEIG
jgi:hypothetical protein